MCKWDHDVLIKKRRSGQLQDSNLRESVNNDVSSLVIREYIQNALDNKDLGKDQLGLPVVVSIRFTDKENSVNRYFSSLIEHIAMLPRGTRDKQWEDMRGQIYRYLNAEKEIRMRTKKRIDYREHRSPKPIQDLFELNQKCMMLEEHNTTGLTGDISDVSEGESKFGNFVFELNTSDTTTTSLGSHGSGRRSMLYASCIQSILVYTSRKNEKLKEVVSGISLTHSRKDKYDTPYMPESYFVTPCHANNGKQTCGCTERNLIEDVKTTFELRRGENGMEMTQALEEGDNSGLSVIIPFPDINLNDRNIKLDILLNFARTIIEGKLTVIQRFREEDKDPLIYNSESVKRIIIETLKENEGFLNSKSRRHGEGNARNKLKMIACINELFGETPLLIGSKPDFVFEMYRKEKSDVLQAFTKRVKAADKLEEIRKKYEKFEPIHLRVKRKFFDKTEESRPKDGHYEIFLKKVEKKGYSLLMRDFMLYTGEITYNKEREGYISLTIAISESDGKANRNHYATFLRHCEALDHRKISADIGESANVEDPKYYINGFKNSYKICEYLERISKEYEVKVVADPFFSLSKKEKRRIRQIKRRNRRNIGFVIESDKKQFTITAAEELVINEGKERTAIEVYVYYGEEDSRGRKPLKDKFLPDFTIFSDSIKEDKIERIEYIEGTSKSRVVYVNSKDFRIRGMIEDPLDASFYIRCKLEVDQADAE